MSSRVKEIKVWSADLGNSKPYTIAFKTIDEVLNVFVEITLENGVRGFGAANPSEYVTGEKFSHTVAALTEENLQFMIGREIAEFKDFIHIFKNKFPALPAANAALDIALHDAFTSHLGIPLVKYLGQKISSMPTSVTIGIKNVQDTLAEASDYAQKGFSILKVKLGKNIDEDIERIVKLREKFGKKFVIRIDANQGYSVKDTIDFFNRARKLDIELIEQPLPAKAIDAMKELPEEIRTVIAADESLLSVKDALTLIKPSRAAGIFNIKLMKCGGIGEGLKIADIALAEGIDLFWGCNDESIVSITAALHAAFACTNTKYIDLDGSLDLERDIVAGGFVLKNGIMSCTDRAGLGLLGL